MKELEQIHQAPGSRALKSLLKKPGQGMRQRKKRVVINEKLNEFFAADYIILIKEECCGDYEEECDCCCQEPEMIRLGNCKECRAEMARHLAEGAADLDPRHNSGPERNGMIDDSRARPNVHQVTHEDEDMDEEEEEEEEEYEEEVDDDDDEAESSEDVDRLNPSSTPTQHEPQQQQQETLSPPEGYKDVCDEDSCQTEGNEMSLGPVVVCGECNYYHQRQRASDAEEQAHQVRLAEVEPNSRGTHENSEESAQQTSEQGQQTTPDLHQRYLVETITMTTVTERRIVREISEEKTGLDKTDGRASIDQQNQEPSKDTNSQLELVVNEEDKKSASKQSEGEKETAESTEMSMTFKMGNVSLVTNSFKPNSAVRQLFPNPRLISQPPALTKVSSILSNDEATDSDGSERYLVTTESLRLFDSVKRAKMAGSRSDSSESDSSTIKRTIERNALRRSLVCKFDATSKKKNLMNKDLTLEERIRQLTCVDQDEDTTADSASDSAVASENLASQDSNQELPPRTSPSGEERPLRNERVVRPLTDSQDHSSPSPPLHHHHHHHHYHHHHHQSSYKKITDLLGQKKIENMPDLGIGDRTTLPKSSPPVKLTSDARKQFLASLAPLSCVASTGVESHQDYYQLSSKMSNRDSVGYNSDSSYSLEDIDAALRSDERNNKNSGGPPDVTRGTPTGTGPNDAPDTTTDELLAFVEQDKTRTERLKRRYDTEDHHEDLNAEKPNGNTNDDEDDELNDYGFNRRPSVRGIKPQFESTSEIVRQLCYRTLPASIEDSRVLTSTAWPYYEAESLDKQRVTFIQEPEEVNGKTRDSTINRINTMQRQIDDIYQTIAETAVSVQGSIERGSYLESTLPRTVPRPPPSVPPPECHRYDQQKNGAHFQDHAPQRLRMAEVSATSVYNNTLPSKNRRAPIAFSNYPCGVMPVESTKCYRTIYLVPNGLADPTYQNIQRILPPHSSPSYANHIERYPYPKNARIEDHTLQPPPRYYPRTPPGHSTGISPSIGTSQPSLQLHLHQPDDVGFSNSTIGMQTVQLQHHQHISQLATYNVQSVPAYTVMAPSRAGGYHPYPVHPGRSASDMQSQTNCLPGAITSSNTNSGGFNGSSQHLVSVSTSSSTSSVLASPTKMHQMNALCSSTERGVPEGAASAPAHDFVSQGHTVGSSFLGHPNNVPPPNTQNSVYYAMNV